MAKCLNKNHPPYVNQREHKAFLRDLKQFHESRGTPFRRIPSLNGKEINLFHLYNEVTNLGGWRKVNDSRRWDVILNSLGFPKACANASLALKQFYIRYLDQYEKIHFLGEDPDDDTVDTGENPARKAHNITFQVPLTYNQHQHEVSEAVRNHSGLSSDVANVSDYEKLTLALQSGLPNEVDFALNVCTLLSNEGKHTLHLEKAPRLVDLLVAYAGVWTENNLSLRPMLLEKWSNLKGRQMARFWNETIDDKDIRELYSLGVKDENSNDDKELFSFPRDLGIREMEGQRVLQIAMILWNLSFEENNVPVLASNLSCLKFLFLCTYCKWSCLRQMGLDTLGNIASEITLDTSTCPNTQIMFRTIIQSVLSSDRFLIIRGLEILTGLCKIEGNENIIIRNLDKQVYEQLCNLLTIHDIMLLIYTLECLYYVTDLGHDICSSILCMHKLVEILVSLVTVEAQSYGSSACIAMKVIETTVPIQPTTPALPSQRPLPAPPPAVTPKSTPITTTVVQGYQEADNDTFAFNWLKAYYEWNAGSSVLQNELYVDYQTTCNKLGKKGLVPPSQLINLLKTLYPQIKIRPSQCQNVRSENHLDGIKRRSVTLPVSIYMPTRNNVNNISTSLSGILATNIQRNTSSPLSSSGSVSVTTLTLASSPILKAQLSAPPRTPTSSSAAGTHHPHLQQALLGKSQPAAVKPTAATPPATPTHIVLSKDSTLIKSLLASKVSQNIILRQQQQQSQVNTSANGNNNNPAVPETCNKITVLVQPQKNDGETQKIISTKVISPLRGSVILSTNRNKEGTVIGNTPIRPRSPKSRINGVPRTIQLEDSRLLQMCSRVEQPKDLAEPSGSVEGNSERLENHVIHRDEESAGKPKSNDIDSGEPSLDKLLRGSSASYQLQNGLSSSQNGTRNSDSPQFVTMEPSPVSSLGDPPVRRKGVLADLLEGKVHKDALLTMNGIVDRSGDHLTDIVENINTTTSVATTSSSGACSESVASNTSTPAQTSCSVAAKCVASVAVVSSNCNSICAVKASALTNGEGFLAKPVKILLPLPSNESSSSRMSLDGARKDVNRLELPDMSKGSVNGSSDSLQGSNSENATTTVCIVPAEWSLSPSASKVIVPPKTVDNEELIGFPRVSMEQLNQLRQQAESLRASNKRPSNEPSVAIASAPDAKRMRLEDRATAAVSSSTSSAQTLMSTSSSLAPHGAQTAVTDALRIRLGDEKFSTLPILTPSEAQQQVSAVLQGSFSEKVTSATSLDSSSSHKLSSLEMSSSNSLPQAKLILKKDATSKPATAGVVVAAGQINTQQPAPKDENKPNIHTDIASSKTVLSSSSSLSSQSSSSSSSSSPLSSSSTVGTSTTKTKKLEYICEWKDCLRTFESPMAVFVHACKVHASEGSLNIPCQWESCDQMTRQRLSLMTHLQDRHCNDHMLRLQATRRQQLSQMGSSTIPAPAATPPHPGYAPNAAVQAIRRHALEFLANKELTGEVTPSPKTRSTPVPPAPSATKTVRSDALPLSMLQDEKEGPVTKSIRLTAALILRNLIMFSSLAKSFVKKYEAHLSVVAMSNVESSRIVAQCLWELNRQQDPRIR